LTAADNAAASLFERACELLPEPDIGRLELLPELSETLIDLGRLDDARVCVEEVIGAPRESHAERLGAEAHLMKLLLELRAGEWEPAPEEAVPQIEVAINLFTAAGDDRWLAKAYRVLANVHGSLSEYGEAATACLRSLEHARLVGDGREQRRAATVYALAACWGPTPVDEAIPRCEAILEEISANRLSSAWVGCLLANLQAMRGDIARGRELYRTARASIEELGGQSFHLAWTSLSGSRVEMLAGDPEAAEHELRRASDLLKGMDAPAPYLLATLTALLARAVYEQNRFDEAERLTRRAEELAQSGDIETQVAWMAVRAKVLAHKGRLEQAATLAQDAVQLLLDTDFVVMKVEALLDLGDVFAHMGDEKASWAFREALQLAERKGNVLAVSKAGLLLDRLEAQPTT
jgi:tetratricopeptide (TPR) repeat protein